MAKKTPAGSAFKFEPQATDYSAVNAYALAQCANLAYDSDKNAAKQTAAWGFPASNYKFFDKGGTQGFAIANDDTAIFAFRGTGNEKEDLLADANIAFTNGPFGTGSRIHQGFARALNEVAKFVERMMRKYKRSGDRSVWFTGHSLGAALATLSTARMRLQQGNTYSVRSRSILVSVALIKPCPRSSKPVSNCRSDSTGDSIQPSCAPSSRLSSRVPFWRMWWTSWSCTGRLARRMGFSAR
jgi:hypothetical protein